MAYDKVVDSTALDAAMSYTANCIRNKTGDTNQIAWDSAKGFGDAVDAITGGGSSEVDENWKYATKVGFGGATLPDTFEVTLPDAQTDFSSIFDFAYVKHITIHSASKPTTLNSTFRRTNNGGLYTVTLDFNTSKVSNYQNCFAQGIGSQGRNFTEINGVLDFSSVTTTANSNAFSATNHLTKVTFAPNTLGVSFNASAIPNINDTSLLSLVNCLKDRTGEDALTLTVASAWKTADTGRLYVNYVKLDAGTGLYVLCEQTDEGAMTIADAITSKNWTIA